MDVSLHLGVRALSYLDIITGNKKTGNEPV